MSITVNNSVSSSYAMSNKNTNKSTANNSNVQNAKAEANDYSPVDTVEISEEAKAAANNVKSNVKDDLANTLQKYRDGILASMNTSHEDSNKFSKWFEAYKSGNSGSVASYGEYLASDAYLSNRAMRNSSADYLFNSNKEDPYLQELSQKLGLTDEQNKEMTKLIFNQFNRLTKGVFEVDNSTYANISQKILTSMEELLAKFAEHK